MADGTRQNSTGLTFRMDNGGRKLHAVYEPTGSDKPPINLMWIRQALAESGLADLFIHDHAPVELLKRYNSMTQPFVFEIGERRDGSFMIRCTPDQVEAYLTITPPYGGSPITTEQIDQALREKGIIVGVLCDEIRAAVDSAKPREILSARGRHAEPGTDGELVSLIPEMKERLPHCDADDDIVDYRDLGEIINVCQGTPLMRRIPPIPGTPGQSVMGREVPPPPVKDAQFAPNLSGTTLSPDDENLLVAAIAGQPILVTDGVTVEPVIKVKNVDLSTGNLSFIGSITVDGDVKTGMTVKASQDISIGGILEAAKVEAGGDIEVRGGIIGHEIRNARGERNEDTAFVRARGSVSALFIESAVVEAGNCIMAQEFAMQSDLTAGNQIIVGQEGSRKGHIIGGNCQAVTLVKAVTLGSHAGVHTRICVGVDPHVSERLSSVKFKLQEKEKELEEINKKLAYFRDNPLHASLEVVDRTRQAGDKLSSAILELTGEKKRLQKRLELVDNAKVVVEKAVLSGTHICIGTKALIVEEDIEGKSFRLEEEGIVASN